MPQLAIAALAALVIAAGSYGAGWKHAQNSRDSEELKQQKRDEELSGKLTDAAVAAIKTIQIKRVTIRQELEREIRLLPSDGRCDLSDGMFHTLNEAITGESGGGTGVPGADSTAGQAVRNPAP